MTAGAPIGLGLEELRGLLADRWDFYPTELWSVGFLLTLIAVFDAELMRLGVDMPSPPRLRVVCADE